MRVARLAALFAVALLVGTAHAATTAGTTAPTGLHGFLLRADEPAQTSFSRTPSFAWNPVPGALHYEFQLALSSTFRDNSVVFADLNISTPVEAPGVTLPWITGSPHSLYARVRAVTPTGATPWSTNYGFDMVAPAAPSPLPSYPGVIRWTPLEGVRLYEVWFVDIPKFVVVATNVIDEREFYTFHQAANWTGTIRWRVRALRADVVLGGTSGTSRYNQIPAVQYGPWSSVYSSTNPAFAGGPIKLVGTVSDVFSNGGANTPAHKLMPAFVWTGNQSLSGQAAELYRVYVFSDKQCLNQVFVELRHRQPGVRAAAVRIADASHHAGRRCAGPIQLPRRRHRAQGIHERLDRADAERGPAARPASVGRGRHAGRQLLRLLVFGVVVPVRRLRRRLGGHGHVDRRLRRPRRPVGHRLAVERLLLDRHPGRGVHAWTCWRRRSCLRARRRTRPPSRSGAPSASTSATRSRSAAGPPRRPPSSPASPPTR